MGIASPPIQPLPDSAAVAEMEGLVNPEQAASAKLCFVDVETTGLDPERNEIWELALLCGEEEYHRYLPITAALADPDALRMNRYYERHPAHAGPDPSGATWTPPNPADVGQEVARLTAGAHLVGLNPAFDATFLGAFLRRYEAVPAWEYHLVDVLPLVAGRFRVRPPWRSKDLSHLLGIAPPLQGERHTAVGDARWARAMYDAVMRE